MAIHLRDLFGKDHFWLELQRNGLTIQDDANENLVRMHERTGIPLVATNDIHYLRAEDCHAQDVLLCINTGAKKDDEKRFRFETDSLSSSRRARRWRTCSATSPKSVTATMDVAEQVDVELTFGKYHVPEFVSRHRRVAGRALRPAPRGAAHALYGTDNSPRPASASSTRRRSSATSGSCPTS